MPLLIGAVVLAASYGAGRALIAAGRIRIEDGLREHATAFAVGFAALALTALLLGSVGAFRPAFLDPIVLAFASIGIVAGVRAAPRAAATWTGLGRLRWLLGGTAVVLVVDGVLAMAPPTAADALAYHLAAPKLWLQAHRMTPLWWNWQTFQPFATEMHYAYAQALWGGAAATVVGAGLGAFSAICVYGFTRELAGRAAAATAALLWAGQGMFLWEATGGFVELALSAFVVLAFWHLVAYLRDPRGLNAALAGLSLGIATSTKILALVFVPVLLAGLLARPGKRAAVGLAAAGGLIVLLPWLLRAWILTGNPIYPLVFGGKYWDGRAAAAYAAEWHGYGVPGIWHLPFFPLEFVLQTSHYERGYGFSPALFVLPLVALAYRRRWVLWLAAAELVYLIVWWQGLHQITRYLLPGLALSTAMSGYAAVELWRRRGWLRWIDWTLAAASAVPLVIITGLFAAQILPGSFGTESTPAFVQRLTGSYNALHWLNSRLPSSGRVLIFGIRDSYWLDRPYLRAELPLFTPDEPESVTLARMRAYDVRYVVVPDGMQPPPLGKVRFIAKLPPVETVTSRTLGRTSATGPELFRVYRVTPSRARR